MPVYPFFPWHCYFSIALLQWTSCDIAEPQKPSHTLDTGPPPLSTQGGGGWNVCIHRFCFLLNCILYTMQHTCTNEASPIYMWQELNTIHELYIQYNAFYSIKTLHTFIFTPVRVKNIKVLSVCKYHALIAYIFGIVLCSILKSNEIQYWVHATHGHWSRT
jgi:hypothetical protein